jgi:hypothetical protein
VDVPAIPATVQPGEAVDWPDPIAGFDAVADEAPAPSKSRKAAAAAPSGEEPVQ